MHMADALISPAVGGSMWAAAGGLIACCARRARRVPGETPVALTGVLGAFVFAAQMINFAIPGTGSSGHLGGGLMLAILLGPHAALLTIASVLVVQAFFFADGGLLALGCNIINLGFFPAFVAYPLVYRPLAGKSRGGARLWAASVVASVVGLQLGALGVVLQTVASGISELPFGKFALAMLPVHLVIGVVEGAATAAVTSFVARARPLELPLDLPVAGASAVAAAGGGRRVLTGFAVAAAALGGVASWFASARPDGLEQAVVRVAGSEEVAGTAGRLHRTLAGLQERTALLPDYGFRRSGAEEVVEEEVSAAAPAWPAAEAGTSVAGLVGGAMTLILAGAAGIALRGRRNRQAHGGG